MLDSMTEQLRRCNDIQSTLEWLLGRTLELTCAGFGNVQIMDWKAGYLEIKAQQGFHEEFLNFFERVRFMDASACARALRNRDLVVIEDIVADQQYAPCLEIVRRAGIRAVQSTPLVSSSGALVGIVSTLFPTPHRPTDIQIRAAKEAAQLAANAIILFRARARTIELDPTNQPGRGVDHTHYEMVVNGKLHTAAAFRARSEMRTLVARAVDALAQSRQLLDEVDTAIAISVKASAAEAKADAGRLASSVVALSDCPACPPRSYCSVPLGPECG